MSIGREKGWGHHSVKVLVEVWDCRLSQTSLIPSEILTLQIAFQIGLISIRHLCTENCD